METQRGGSGGAGHRRPATPAPRRCLGRRCGHHRHIVQSAGLRAVV